MKNTNIKLVPDPSRKPIEVYGRGDHQVLIGRIQYHDRDMNGHAPGYFFTPLPEFDLSVGTVCEIWFKLRELNRSL